jgi:hypothetical protein
LLLIVALAGIGYYVSHRFESDPGGATASLLRMFNVGYEVTAADDNGRLTLRDRNTGQVTKLNLNELKNTTFRFGSDGLELTIEDAEQRIVIGGGKPPDWIPTYPGAKVKRTMTTRDGESAGSQTFQTNDGASGVLGFFEQEFGKAGMQVTRPSPATLLATRDKREVSVVADWDGDASTVSVSYTTAR